MSTMIEAPVPAPLQWTEGMLLSPQHLQQNDIYWHSLLWQMMQTRPHAFGVMQMQVELHTGDLRVESLRCVMPDGLYVDYPSERISGPLELKLGTDDFGTGESLTIYLTVPRRKEGAARGSDPGRRFEHLDGRLEIDENTGENQVPVPRLAPRVSLQVDRRGVDRDLNVTMPLLEIHLAGGQMELAEFHPPLLRIGASDFHPPPVPSSDDDPKSAKKPPHSLHLRLRDLMNLMRDKVKDFAGSDGMSGERARIVTALPIIELIVDSYEMHPFDAYMALAQVYGQLAPLSGDRIPGKLNRYDHQNPAACFGPVIAQLTATVMRIGLPRARLVFTPVEPPSGVFRIEVPDDADASDLMVEIVPRSGQSPQSVERWIARARIGVSDLIPELTRRRETGASPARPTAKDLKALRLENTDSIYRLKNTSIQIDDTERPAIQSGATLQISGPNNADLPAGIVLWLAPAAGAADTVPTLRND